MTRVSQLKRPDSLSKIAEETIRDRIVQGTFRLGEPLQEAKLSADLGISKTPIREALAALKLQGLVEIFPQRGAFVFTLSQARIVQLCRYRLLLENAALDLSLKSDPKPFLAALSETFKDMTRAKEKNDFQKYLGLDSAFHETFFKHCGNEYLADGYKKVDDVVRTMRTHLSLRPERTDKSYEEHESILRGLASGDVDAAKAVLDTHIRRGERAYQDLTETGQA
ncbi:MAG: GntR family transcriptional regulator [Pseudomonadota bacterium]